MYRYRKYPERNERFFLLYPRLSLHRNQYLDNNQNNLGLLFFLLKNISTATEPAQKYTLANLSVRWSWSLYHYGCQHNHIQFDIHHVTVKIMSILCDSWIKRIVCI
jgi:hypothetical protein